MLKIGSSDEESSEEVNIQVKRKLLYKEENNNKKRKLSEGLTLKTLNICTICEQSIKNLSINVYLILKKLGKK